MDELTWPSRLVESFQMCEQFYYRLRSKHNLGHKEVSYVSISLLNTLRLKMTWVGIEWDCFTCEIAFTVGNQDFFFSIRSMKTALCNKFDGPLYYQQHHYGEILVNC